MPIAVRVLLWSLQVAAYVLACVCFYITGKSSAMEKTIKARDAVVDLMLEKIKEFEREKDAAERLKNIGFMNGFLFCIETLREEEQKRHV